MASSSSSPRTWRYRVFTSFHGPDVRTKLLSHLRKTFNHYGITMFDDQRIERSDIISPALIQAIRESRISIVVLSKNYASSPWCLDELLEILKCKEDAGQIVMTVFYGVTPSDVRNQLGDFGNAFNKTCALNTEEHSTKWRDALTYVGNIAGEDFQNCTNEAERIEKIAKDVLKKLNVTPSRDFEGKVGLDAHLRKIESLLDLDNDRVKIFGIFGPAGIGKSTIARALRNQLSSLFPRSCFMDNIRGRYHSGSDIYTSKLDLQGKLLSKILNQNNMVIGHFGAIEDWLHDQKVLIILDDVERLDQLEALANIKWFGPGSRVLVTTENKEILQKHDDIDGIYHVDFPSESEARMIFCQYAFKQNFPPYEFRNLAYEVVRSCGNLPLGLQVLGSSFREKSTAEKSTAELIDELRRLKNCLDGEIESALKVGYESLHQKDQDLFLFIAVFFNYKHVDHVTSMLAKTNLNVSLGLKNLANRCLINRENSKVVMHHLLQLMARQVIFSQEPWKLKILADPQYICYVLENEKGNGSTLGISFDVAEINELKISRRAFESMYNLVFLEVYKGLPSQEVKLHIPEEMDYLPLLRLLRWDAYPRKSLPLRFCPENLIELDMADSQLEKLWEGTQRLANLKKMNLHMSSRLKELPDLSNATNLERLILRRCSSLLVLPSSISNLHKLVKLDIWWCESLETIPTLANLTSLREIDMKYCSRLRNFPESLRHCSRIENVYLGGSRNLKTFSTHLPTSVIELDLYESGIKRITDCIKGLHNLELLELTSCKRLTSLPKLPCSLRYLEAINCESLERVSGPLNTPHADLYFINCFKLDGQARQTIIQRSFVTGFALLPGKEVPAEFDYRAIGNSLTITHSNFNRFKVCVVLSPVETDFDESSTDEDDLDEATIDEDEFYEAVSDIDEATRDEDEFYEAVSDIDEATTDEDEFYEADIDEATTDEDDDNELKVSKHCINIDVPRYKHLDRLASEHLFIFYSSLPFIDSSKVSRKTVLEFSSHGRKYFDIIECGIQILTDETDRNNNGEDGGNDEASDEEEAFDNEDYVSESGEASDEEDDEEGDKSDLFFYHKLYNFKLP